MQKNHLIKPSPFAKQSSLKGKCENLTPLNANVVLSRIFLQLKSQVDNLHSSAKTYYHFRNFDSKLDLLLWTIEDMDNDDLQTWTKRILKCAYIPDEGQTEGSGTLSWKKIVSCMKQEERSSEQIQYKNLITLKKLRSNISSLNQLLNETFPNNKFALITMLVIQRSAEAAMDTAFCAAGMPISLLTLDVGLADVPKSLVAVHPTAQVVRTALTTGHEVLTGLNKRKFDNNVQSRELGDYKQIHDKILQAILTDKQKSEYKLYDLSGGFIGNITAKNTVVLARKIYLNFFTSPDKVIIGDHTLSSLIPRVVRQQLQSPDVPHSPSGDKQLFGNRFPKVHKSSPMWYD